MYYVTTEQSGLPQFRLVNDDFKLNIDAAMQGLSADIADMQKSLKEQQAYIEKQMRDITGVPADRMKVTNNWNRLGLVDNHDSSHMIFYRDDKDKHYIIKTSPLEMNEFYGHVPTAFKVGDREMKMIARIDNGNVTITGNNVSIVNGNIIGDVHQLQSAVQTNVPKEVEEKIFETLPTDNKVNERYEKKHAVKTEQKAAHKRKFKWVIGNHYVLKRKPRDGGKALVWEYELIKYVYSIDTCPMNSLIVKKISGPDELIYSISPNDCKRLHIKYQPGLEIMSMDTEGLMPKKIRKSLKNTK